MSDETTYTPLQTMEALEAAVFRLGRVGRRLLADHPDLPVRRIRPCVYGHDEGATAQFEVSASDVDGVRLWAKALGVEPTVNVHGSPHAFEFSQCKVEIDDVEVMILGTRTLSADEAAARLAERDQSAAAGGDAR